MRYLVAFLLRLLGAPPADHAACTDQLGETVTDALSAVSEHLQSAGGRVPACDPVIRAVEEDVCTADDDMYARAANHASLRDLLVLQGDPRRVELHCCMELALRRKLSDELSGREDTGSRREANAAYLQDLESGAICTRSPICPADVLAPGFALRCESVSAAMTPIPRSPAPVVRPQSVVHPQPLSATTTPPPPVRPTGSPPLRSAGITMTSLGVVGVAVLGGMLGLGAAATEQIRLTSGDARMRWATAGAASESVAIASGALAFTGLVSGIPLLYCARAGRCARRHQSEARLSWRVDGPGLSVSGRF